MGRPAIATEERDIGVRMRLVRTAANVSERFAAEQSGLSRDQLVRIERGRAAVRFFPAWNFCQFTDINPLWLAFGEPEGRHGFTACANSTVPDDARFLEVLQRYGERYRTYRFLTHSSMFEAASVFSDEQSLLSADMVQLSRRAEPEEKLGSSGIKLYLTPAKMPEPLTWAELRDILRSRTQSSEAKIDLARQLGVTLAAVSQWRSGATTPTADKTLQILAWVRKPDVKTTTKKSAGSAVTRPARKTRQSKSTSHEKAESDQGEG